MFLNSPCGCQAPTIDSLPGRCYVNGKEAAMVKVFQGDVQSVQNDVNSWIEVYQPAITAFKQSLIVVEHNIIIVLTFLYEAKSETGKVEYKFDKFKK
jgi:hypothetical protein